SRSARFAFMGKSVRGRFWVSLYSIAEPGTVPAAPGPFKSGPDCVTGAHEPHLRSGPAERLRRPRHREGAAPLDDGARRRPVLLLRARADHRVLVSRAI